MDTANTQGTKTTLVLGGTGKTGQRVATDTSRDYVYTEWESVKLFVEEFLELLPSRTAR
jgi:hypothetical protein